jgi:hypothetical protein
LVIIHGSNVIIAVLAAKGKFAKNEKISVLGVTNLNPHAEKKIKNDIKLNLKKIKSNVDPKNQ